MKRMMDSSHAHWCLVARPEDPQHDPCPAPVVDHRQTNIFDVRRREGYQEEENECKNWTISLRF